MDIEWALGRVEAGAAAVAALLGDVDDAEAGWRPAPGEWSVREVVGHLADEERADFRQRLDLTLHRPGAPWPPIDPEGWVREHDYQGRALADLLADFLAERGRSLAWLRGLAAPDLERAERHPAGFSLRAGDLLAAWVAHDSLHLRQLVELRYHATARSAAPYSVEYAGDW